MATTVILPSMLRISSRFASGRFVSEFLFGVGLIVSLLAGLGQHLTNLTNHSSEQSRP
jgi:hypothetical protein